ncbi:peptidase inhibitor family I36 protein [Saccharothrix sp. HUAS TT1]|uniref:peptidase inhibitor family I36 protein n=1 Tax=unclassified Saccharothrix TaxID=2593673 RepID=UPI00345C0CF8
MNTTSSPRPRRPLSAAFRTGGKALTALAAKPLVVAAVLAACATPPLAAASHDASPSGYDCPSGGFCLYSGWDGAGTRCYWPDDEVKNTNDDCSFIRNGHHVRSVWNNNSHRVQYYKSTNHNDRVGSTGSLAGGNLQGNYQILSFKPQ